MWTNLRTILALNLVAWVALATPELRADELEPQGPSAGAEAGAQVEPKAAREQRAREKAEAEATVAGLTGDQTAQLSDQDWIRVAWAYNHLGQNDQALKAINQVSESRLAELGELESKGVYFYNVAQGTANERPCRLRELAFLQRCIDRGYGRKGYWLWRKAIVLCQTSVECHVLNGGTEFCVFHDREQYEDAFETLKLAVTLDPQLLNDTEAGAEFLWGNHFPKLSSEARFLSLMRK